MKTKLASAFMCTALMYCGGGRSNKSGVDGSAAVGTLSATEADDLCEYLLTVPEVRTVTCDIDGQMITINLGTDPAELDEEIADCAADFAATPDCDGTVSEAESCAEANADQIDGLSDDEICDIAVGGEQPALPAACQVFLSPTCEVE